MLFSPESFLVFRQALSLTIMIAGAYQVAAVAKELSFEDVKAVAIPYFFFAVVTLIVTVRLGLSDFDIGSAGLENSRMQSSGNAVGLGYATVSLALPFLFLFLAERKLWLSVLWLICFVFGVIPLWFFQSRGPLLVLVVLSLIIYAYFIFRAKLIPLTFITVKNYSLILFIFLLVSRLLDSFGDFNQYRIFAISQESYLSSREIYANELEMFLQKLDAPLALLTGYGYSFNGIAANMGGSPYRFEQLHKIVWYDVGMLGMISYVLMLIIGIKTLLRVIPILRLDNFSSIGVLYIYSSLFVVIVSSPISYGLFDPSGLFFLFIFFVIYLDSFSDRLALR
jgi:hypothetical protein